MRDHDVDRTLRRLHATRPPGDGAHRRRLRDELLAAHRRRYPQRKGWTIMTHRIWFRPALIGVAVLALGIAACTTPTEYDVEVGQKMTISFADAAKSGDVDALIEAVAAYAETLEGVEGLWVSVDETDGGEVTGELALWGQDLDPAALQAALAAQFPELADAAITVTPLEGPVQGSLAEALGHEVFAFEVDGETAEAVRLQILQQLAAQGFDGEAQVEVVDEDGLRTINIDLEDLQDQDGAGGDSLVIELKQD